MSLALANLLKNISNVYFFKCENDFPQCMYKINRILVVRYKIFKNKQEVSDCKKCIKNLKI